MSDKEEDSGELIEFMSCLHRINSIQDKKDFTEFCLNFFQNEEEIEICTNIILYIFQASAVIARSFDFIRVVQVNIQGQIRGTTQKVEELFEIYSARSMSSTGFQLFFKLVATSDYLRTIRDFRPPSEFIYEEQTSAKGSLDSFISVANKLKENPSFSSTPLGQFEDIVLDTKKAFVDNLDPYLTAAERLSYKDKLNTTIFETTFIAHVSPSFEGKTQSAFLLSKVRPLYFALDQFNKDRGEAQKIYMNFKSLSIYLARFAKTDLFAIDIVNDNSDLIEKISQSSLLESYNDTPFMVLGFLAYLIDDAQEHFDPNSGRVWMDFYANRQGRPSSTFNSMTITQFKEKLVKSLPSKYCLFLDEFGKSSWMSLENRRGWF